MIRFLRFTWLYILISVVVISIGVFTVATKGLVFSIDFTGGSILEYKLDGNVESSEIEKILTDKDISIQELSVKDSVVSAKTSPITEVQEKDIRDSVTAIDSVDSVSQLRFETVGPSLGKETLQKTIIASIVAILGILLYISYTFKKLTFGMAAIAAMLHDFLVLIGMYALLRPFGAEVDALFITSLLTTMSFSVHDTIVVFDKIREYKGTSGLSLEILANKALTETMIRSINNSITIMLMLVPLVFMGGDSIRFFAAALLIGTITGTYSSPFVATPLLVFFEKKFGK